jgi:hypothetical protein
MFVVTPPSVSHCITTLCVPLWHWRYFTCEMISVARTDCRRKGLTKYWLNVAVTLKNHSGAAEFECGRETCFPPSEVYHGFKGEYFHYAATAFFHILSNSSIIHAFDAYFLAIGSVLNYPTRTGMKSDMSFVYSSSGFIVIDVNASLGMQ